MQLSKDLDSVRGALHTNIESSNLSTEIEAPAKIAELVAVDQLPAFPNPCVNTTALSGASDSVHV
jgi:hypothetical protein